MDTQLALNMRFWYPLKVDGSWKEQTGVEEHDRRNIIFHEPLTWWSAINYKVRGVLQDTSEARLFYAFVHSRLQHHSILGPNDRPSILSHMSFNFTCIFFGSLTTQHNSYNLMLRSG